VLVGLVVLDIVYSGTGVWSKGISALLNGTVYYWYDIVLLFTSGIGVYSNGGMILMWQNILCLILFHELFDGRLGRQDNPHLSVSVRTFLSRACDVLGVAQN
jgi:hypothetical protein